MVTDTMQRENKHPLMGKTVLLTGGTGSFGQAFIRRILAETDATIRVFSRDELKQYQVRERFGSERLRFMVGDVRDRRRLLRAANGVDVIVHAAAMKQVPACEYNPFEAVQTNVIGAQNVVEAAIDASVGVVVALSTDKAVNPVNVYGATKLCAEKIVVQGNVYAAGSSTQLFCVRYGNVMGSRGSVIPLFIRQREEGRLTITDERMSRFWITLDEAVDLVINSLIDSQGGEIFVPKIPSMRIVDLADAIAPGIPRVVTGIRAGEKIHETLITSDESRHAFDLGNRYVIMPENARFTGDGKPLVDGWTYTSDTNDEWLSSAEIRKTLESWDNLVE